MTTPQSRPSFYNPDDEESLNFKRYVSLIISNWYWFATALFISLSIAYGINRWSEKVYTVSSTILIKDDRLAASTAGLSNIFPGTDAYKSQQSLNNEMGILKSFKLNYRVMCEMPDFHVVYVKVGKRGIAETRLYKNCPFIVRYDSLGKQNLNVKIRIKVDSEEKIALQINGQAEFDSLHFGERFNKYGFDFTIMPRDSSRKAYDPGTSNKYYFYFADPYELANNYRGSLSVAPITTDATLVTLSTTGPVAQQEADYLNMLMKLYIDQGLELKNETAKKTIEFIDKQLGQISDSLSRVEGKMENFRLGNRFIDISQEGINIQNKLNQVESEKTDLMLQKRYYVYLKDFVEARKEEDIVAPTVMGVTDQLLIKLVDELAQLQQQKKQMAMNLNESGEPLKVINANILSVRNSLNENIKSGLQNIENSITDIEERLRQAENSMDKLPSTERRMINIQRQFDINNTVYTFLLEKKAEAGIAGASNVPDNRVIDNAGPFSTSRIKPKARQNLLIALILGLLIPMAGIFLIDALNNKIIDKKDIEKRTGAPVIGFISHNNLQTEMPVVENPGSTLSESFRAVRTNLKYFVKDTACPVIAVSSTISAEGKTFCAVNLSAILALSGKRVLLVGLDLRKPRISKILDLQNGTGLSSYLIGEEDYKNVIVKTNIENLWHALSGPRPPNPAELIESDAMVKFIEKAKKEFDYIVIDTPPVAIVTDALLISPFTDFYLFVVRQRYSSKNTLELIEDIHKNENIKSIGIIINDINLSGYYGYGLRYGYSFGYGYNYGYSYYGNSGYGKYGYSDSVKGYYKEDS